MSPKAAAEFGRQWPALQRRLRSFLFSRNVPASEVDDLVQEVATRLVSFWPKIDNDRPIWPLTATIALNLLRDRSRRCDAELPGELPEFAGPSDVADAGIARIELAAVIRAMDSLTPSQRAALLQAIEPDGNMASTPAEKMLRMRARRRLADAVGRACGGLAFKFRRLADNLQGFFSKAEGVTQALACSACLLVASAGSVTFDTPLRGGLEGGTVPSITVIDAGDLAALTTSAPASIRGEQLSPSRIPASVVATGSSEATSSRTAGTKAKRSAPSSPAAASVGHAPGLTVPDAPSLPNGDAPIPTPEPPGTPDQPVHPPTVNPPTPGTPTQPPQGDAPVGVVEEVTDLLDENAPR